MKFFVLLFVFVLSVVAVKTQSETDAAVPTGPEDDITNIQERGVAILEIRILTANLPDDLQVKAQAVLLNAQIQLGLCKSAFETNLIIWQYKVCVITKLKLAHIGVNQLEVEAAGRPKTDNGATVA